ncbi:PH domain-containing protein [Candidatus Roizmanbacteria bacterium]|nr:PH domain-containing protein [Candidatus Roizmanbacteria bacterium]
MATEASQPKGQALAMSRTVLRESVVVLLFRLMVLETLFVSIVYFSDGLFLLLGTALATTDGDPSFVFPWYTLLRVILWIGILGYTIYIVLRWRTNHYEIRRSVIIHRSGIVFKKEEEYICNVIESITLFQGFFGRICNYGTLEIFDPALQKRVYVYNISDPLELRRLIRTVVVGTKPPPTQIIFDSHPPTE